jgi:hypothetical protein
LSETPYNAPGPPDRLISPSRTKTPGRSQASAQHQAEKPEVRPAEHRLPSVAQKQVFAMLCTVLNNIGFENCNEIKA